MLFARTYLSVLYLPHSGDQSAAPHQAVQRRDIIVSRFRVTRTFSYVSCKRIVIQERFKKLHFLFQSVSMCTALSVRKREQVRRHASPNPSTPLPLPCRPRSPTWGGRVQAGDGDRPLAGVGRAQVVAGGGGFERLERCARIGPSPRGQGGRLARVHGGDALGG